MRKWFGIIALMVVANADTIDFSPEQIESSVQLIENAKSGDSRYDEMIGYLNNFDDRFDKAVIQLAKDGDRKAQYLLTYWADNCRTDGLYDASEAIKPSLQQWAQSTPDDTIAGFIQFPQGYDEKYTKDQVRILIKAALWGQPDAQYVVYGLLASKNEEKAMKYLTDAARNAQPDAIEQIAIMTDPLQPNNRFFKKNPSVSAYLYWYAAQSAGHSNAKVTLSQMMAKGIGTKKDSIIAYALNLTAHNDANFCYAPGYSARADYWDDLLQKRKQIAKSMNKKQIDQAIRLSKNPQQLLSEAKQRLLYRFDKK